MKVWIRVFPLVNAETEAEVPSLEVAASLSIDVYPNESAARAAAEKRGGIVFEVDAASLRECNEFDNTFCLSRGDESFISPRLAYISVVFGSLPHKWDQRKMVAKFDNPVARDWLRALEEGLGRGACIHQ